MTISPLELYQIPTDHLANVSKFYPAKIHVPHHQLRRFISTAEKDRIYYATDNDIYILDLERQQSSLLATVSFSIRCLAAKHGWICVGGESEGQCAFMKLEADSGFPKCFGYEINEKKLGGEIVNSMNIQIMLNHGNGEDEPIVLISNNDKTVKQYSLVQREVISASEHDVPMNYAAMSPDCNIIAAVGDCEKVFFARRSRADGIAEKKRSRSEYPEYEWHTIAEPTIPTGEAVYDDYGFAVSFSPSGHLCAASAQGGAITVFDMSVIQDPNRTPESAIVCSFRSSRPTVWGCVRAMEFSPEPWDLLAWAEDHGRIGVADLRQQFIRRQILDLNNKNADTARVEDGTPVSYKGLSLRDRLEQQNLVRLRSMRGTNSRGSRVDQLLSETRAEASQRRRSRHGPLSYHQGLQLDARERSILEALEITMDDVEPNTVPPYSLNYSSSPRYRPSVTAAEQARESDGQIQPRTGSRAQQPRRRSSIVIADPNRNRNLVPAESPRGRISASPGRIADEDETMPLSNNDSTSIPTYSILPALPSGSVITNPWQSTQSLTDNAHQMDNDIHMVSDDRPATLSQIEDALENERQIGNQLHRQLNDEQRLTDLLRQRLEAQERLLQSQQQELDSERDISTSNQQPEGTLRQASDQTSERRRSRDLAMELQRVNHRARQLESQRARLLESNEQRVASNFATTSAQTTTLPTTNLRQGDQTHNLDLTLDYQDVVRSRRMAHIENLEDQLRQAETQMTSTTSDVWALEEALQQGIRNRRMARDNEARSQLRSRTLAAARGAGLEISPEEDASSRGSTTTRRGELATNPTRTFESRRSELSGGISDAELQLARMMYRSRIRALDANGNWDATAIARLLGHTDVLALSTMTSDQIQQERGFGTAGLGWSPDGRHLFAGSTEGIFEINLNLKDRMTFPAFELR